MASATTTRSVGRLSPDELRAATDLLDTCNQHESIDVPIFLPTLAAETDARTAILMEDGGALVGFAAIPDDREPEVSLMVHPQHRRRGIGRTLVREVRAELVRRELGQCLLVADQGAASALAFLAALEIPYDSSEYRLELDRNAVDRSRPREAALTMRPATAGDMETLVRVLAAAFQDADERARANVTSTFQETARRFYLAELDGEPVGAIRVGEWGGNGDITGFGVVPEHQGKGYGRQMLLDAVDLLIARDLPRILIEVAVENRSALGLYESCGFRVAREYGYYTLTPDAL